MTSAAFTLRATQTASILRSPAKVGGKIGAPVEHIASLKCYPLVQVGDPKLVERYATHSNSLISETYVQGGLDIVGGDFMVIDGKTLAVCGVNRHPWPPDGLDRLHIIVEEIKTL